MKDNTAFLMAASIYSGYLAATDVVYMSKSIRENLMEKATADAMLLIGKMENKYSTEELKVVEK